MDCTDASEDSNLSDRDMVGEIDGNPVTDGETDVQLVLPQTLLNEVPHGDPLSDAMKISFVMYQNAKLFPLQEDENSNISINSPVVSASVLGLQVTDLEHPVTVRLSHTETVGWFCACLFVCFPFCIVFKQAPANTSICVYWDFSMNGTYGK